MEKEGMCAVMLPFLAHGHMIPLLQLSRMLAIRGVTVIYVSTPSNLHQIRTQAQRWDVAIHFQEVPMPRSPLPPGCENTSQVPRQLIPDLFEATEKLEEPFDALMEELTIPGSGYYEDRGLPPPERLILIHDVWMGWSETVAAKFRVPSFTFVGLSAYNWLSMKARFWQEESTQDVRDLLKAGPPDVIRDVMKRQMERDRQTMGILINTFWEMEPKFLQRVLEEQESPGKPVWSVGPLTALASKRGDAEEEDKNENEGYPCLQWLDRQSRDSVVYIAFGSETPILGEQMREVALGLEASGQPFLWVIKPPVDCSSTDWKSKNFPADYEARLNGRGFIECGWAPQSLILSHESTGAYITHCGWNSVCEGVVAGVPMIVWPFFYYLQAAAVILTREVKVAVEMGNTMTERDGLVRREEVESAIRRLMLEEEGIDIKKRIKALSKAAIGAIADDHGSAWKALDSFLGFAKQKFKASVE